MYKSFLEERVGYFKLIRGEDYRRDKISEISIFHRVNRASGFRRASQIRGLSVSRDATIHRRQQVVYFVSVEHRSASFLSTCARSAYNRKWRVARRTRRRHLWEQHGGAVRAPTTCPMNLREPLYVSVTRHDKLYFISIRFPASLPGSSVYLCTGARRLETGWQTMTSSVERREKHQLTS